MKVTEANRKTLLKLAWPLILASASDVIMTTVDTAFVGRLGTVQIAAVGLSGFFVWASYCFFKGTMFSVGALTSQNFGAGRYRYCTFALSHGLIIALFCGAFFFFYRHALPWFFHLMEPTAEVQQASIAYTNIRLLGATGYFASVAFAGYFRGIGNVRTLFKVSLFANVLNIVLDYLLIFTFAMGIKGAAIATAVSQLTGALVYLMAYVFFKNTAAVKRFSLNIAEMKKLLRIGLPYNFKLFTEVVIFFLFTMFVGRLGDAQLAATTIMLQLMVFTSMVSQGFGQGGEVMVGQFIGARLHDKASRSGMLAMETTVSVMVTFALIMLLFPVAICSIFNASQEVLTAFKSIVALGVVAMCCDSLQMVAGSCLEGAGDTKAQFMYTVAIGYLIFLPMIYLLTSKYKMGIWGAWLSFCVFMIALGAALYCRFKWGKWKKVQLIEQSA